MASFFYLSSSNDYNNNNNNNNNNNKADTETSPSEIYVAASTGVLELWPQHEAVSSSPVAAAAPGGNCYDAIGYHFGDTALFAGHGGAGGLVRGRSGSGMATTGGMNCLDCGNQAKKQCAHMRCRACCKSRGFDCETHVKSTWVPAAKRREKQQMQLQIQQRGGGVGRSSSFHVDLVHRNSNSLSKRHKEIVPNSLTQGSEVARAFPEEVNTTALLRCVRLSGTAEELGDDEEYAYQAAVSIGGHIFKGLLYDQGSGINTDAMAQCYNNSPAGDSSSGGSAAHSSLNLITPAAPSGSADVSAGNHPSSAGVLDPSLLFPAPLNAFMTGAQFFPPPRS